MEENTILPNLPQLEWVQTIRDPIWGEIPITEIEREIIQTETFYRLRGIKQLSFAYLSFPGAVHCRFEHSLGVMHATDMLLKMVRRDVSQGIQIRSFSRQILRVAALLHDIGHPPFSHAMEDLFTFYPDMLDANRGKLPAAFEKFLHDRGKESTALGRHETFTEFLIYENDDIKRVLKRWIEKEFAEIIPGKNLAKQAEGIIIEVIARLAVGKPIDPELAPGKIVPLIRIFKSIMSGDIDADKIDYLMRDNYYCGLPHGLDLASLRNRLTPGIDGLAIQAEAVNFVRSLILARYRLITEVHHEKWSVFATAKVMELLHQLLSDEQNPAQKIFEIFTTWNDSKLLDYLLQSDDPTIKAILTTQYPLEELARLEYLDTHPFIRECVQILSEPINHYQIPYLQKDLRTATGRDDIFIHIHSVKSPEFSMRLVGGGNLLRDEILRGISEESIKNLHMIVYGDKAFRLVPEKTISIGSELLPCENCPHAENCIGNLEDPKKKLLAELAVRQYRKICQRCGKSQIVAADFLLLIMEKVGEIVEANNVEHPIRQELYKIARLVFDVVRGNLTILGAIDLNQAEISSSFYQEIRKCEQLGLIVYSREICKLQSEDDPNRYVFRYDRRFRLSNFGRLRLDKVRYLCGKVSEYDDYIESWRTVQNAVKQKNAEIVRILLASGKKSK